VKGIELHAPTISTHGAKKNQTLVWVRLPKPATRWVPQAWLFAARIVVSAMNDKKVCLRQTEPPNALRRGAVLKHFGQVLNDRPFPLADLGRMHLILTGKLRHRLYPRQRFQSHFGLEGRLMSLSFRFHLVVCCVLPSSRTQVHQTPKSLTWPLVQIPGTSSNCFQMQ